MQRERHKTKKKQKKPEKKNTIGLDPVYMEWGTPV